MNSRDLIDYASEDDAVNFRSAMYSAIHDRVTAHIESKKQEIAQSLLNRESVEELDEELYYQHAKKLMDQGRDSHKPGPGAPYGRTFDGDAYHNPPGKSRLHVMDNGKKVKTVHVPDEHIERMDSKGKLEWPNHMDPTIEKHHFDAYAKTNAKHISDPVKESVESIDELSKSTLASYTGKAYKDQGVRMAKAGYISGLYKAGTDKNINAKQLRKVVGKDETRKDKNRDAGVNRALGRLSKEEVESMDEAGSPFDKDYKSQTGNENKKRFTSKTISTGTVYSRIPNEDNEKDENSPHEKKETRSQEKKEHSMRNKY